MASPPVQYRNRLLSALSSAEHRRIEPHLSRYEFPVRSKFEEPGRAIKAVHFIESGIASVVANGRGSNVEVGLIGREGFVGIPLLLGAAKSPFVAYAQVAGVAYSMPASALSEVMAASAALRALMLKSVHVYMVQTGQTALANGRAKLEARLARWILMAHDRIEGDDLPITHELLSTMLGVRRAGVTVAVQFLRRKGLIEARRGAIQVLDRKGLEEMSNGTYGVPEAELRRLFE